MYGKDYLLLTLASVGVILWYITDSAIYALAIAIGISALCGIATTVKTYREPDVYQRRPVRTSHSGLFLLATDLITNDRKVPHCFKSVYENFQAV